MPDNNDPRHGNESAAAWLSKRLGVAVTGKTLTNMRAQRRGPQPWEYFGQRPVIKESRLEHYASHEALKNEPTSRRNRRHRSAASSAPGSAPGLNAKQE
jgi:hypothetical protein